MIDLQPRRRKKIKRRKDAPVIVPKKRRPMGHPDPVRRARILAITARTKAARAEIDALIAGAPKMPEIDRLPVMVRDPAAPSRSKKSWRRWSGEDDNDDDEAERADEPVAVTRKRRPPRLPYKVFFVKRAQGRTRCSTCGRTGHNSRSCREPG